ncbi:hypothetical protein Pmani_006311 [Petrolisthes manimaculis]|uniref:Uncharacterized protein n=1 Tax=Petrolisthes manimaculis TaxID=1843537 RepID=A0AAE1QB61_9EUCA|nr:hypothetical protein Pmani_006311 [Petrolisthes manimaculis]
MAADPGSGEESVIVARIVAADLVETLPLSTDLHTLEKVALLSTLMTYRISSRAAVPKVTATSTEIAGKFRDSSRGYCTFSYSNPGIRSSFIVKVLASRGIRRQFSNSRSIPSGHGGHINLSVTLSHV